MARPDTNVPTSSLVQLINPFRKMLPGKYLSKKLMRVLFSEHVNQQRHMMRRLFLILGCFK
jgi:hypothetical protein